MLLKAFQFEKPIHFVSHAKPPLVYLIKNVSYIVLLGTKSRLQILCQQVLSYLLISYRHDGYN